MPRNAWHCFHRVDRAGKLEVPVLIVSISTLNLPLFFPKPVEPPRPLRAPLSYSALLRWPPRSDG